MNDHITKNEFAEYVSGYGSSEIVNKLESHLSDCPHCARLLQELQRFTGDLDQSWNRERLFAMGAAHPSATDLERLCAPDHVSEHDESLRRHVEQCPSCKEHLQRLEHGFNALFEADPLGRSIRWPAMMRSAFAVGIEVLVEASRGAYMTAGSLVREVMTPQQTLRFEPTTALAMGGQSHGAPDLSTAWYDARFATDETCGEITGSTDPTTGLGVVTVTIHKTLAYMATTPLVELHDGNGAKVAEQYALDTGERYLVTFDNLSEGSYLVGIREPSA